ncbi:glycosyl hydrolase 2 galactose-binding domain-containing protein [Vibrio hippocampi]|uniref:Beta-mannosidase-like galactose-binding domain-containing protein n=1 Tax=Vibrio hippocampi TaxID=654686 RepID=A0ABM8ZEB9_9VIBR|nr:hypothetical protein [Vibrio hippocampi]CAH0524599.1 hypothetical protein VHP8226_00439 [Vibrio hippocampi]
MRLNLQGLWQLSPLTDLSIPQDDLQLPGAISQVLPKHLSEQMIAEQEWHLMHDFELTQQQFAASAIDIVLSAVSGYSQIRINGRAVMDCDGKHQRYRKEIKGYLQLGLNRIEILFLEQDEEDLLLDEESVSSHCSLVNQAQTEGTVLGIWDMPYLQFIPHTRLEHITMQQIWHHGGGCEFKVDVYFQTYRAGLVSATIKFDGVSFTLPVDVRCDKVSALFQIEAPLVNASDKPYQLDVMLDGQSESVDVVLDPQTNVQHCVV